MNDAIARLFSLERLRPGQEGVAFEFALAIPLWGWILIALALAGVAFWSYSRLAGSFAGRVAGAALRTLALLLLVLLLAGPRLVRQRERLERDWVAMLVDRSASMKVADAGEVAGPARSRDQQLTDLLTATRPSLDQLARDKSMVWLGFDAGVFDLEAPGAAQTPAGSPSVPFTAGWGPAEGRRSDLDAALREALRRLAARPASGLVVFSDGRASTPVDAEVLRRLEQEKLPVFVVPLGSEDPPTDLAVGRIDAPGVAFLDDLVPVNVEVAGRGPRAGAKVQLIEASSGRVLDERRLEDDPLRPGSTADETREQVVLLHRPTEAGETSWTVRVIPDRPDLSPENDSKSIALSVVDRPIRIVYFEGYPRWEYRYVKNLLVRERSIRSSVMLLAPNRRFLQEGTDPLLTVPRSPGEWGEFDAVLMGDVRPELFSDDQLQQIREIVSARGVGLLWIGGPYCTPDRWAGTVLADLIPFSTRAEDGASISLRTWLRPVVFTRGPAADRLGVLRLGDAGADAWPAGLNDQPWSALRWVQRIDTDLLKPTAEILAYASPAEGSPDEPSASVVTMRYGAGRSIYVATDETWRWRYGRGETLQERFWLPLFRLLARDSLGRSGRPALLELSTDQARVEQPVRVTVRLLDQSMVSTAPAKVTVRMRRVSESGAVIGGESVVELTREASTDARSQAAVVYSGTVVATEAGRYRLEPTDAALSGIGMSAELEVFWPDDELRHPDANHALLADLAEKTGGKVLTKDTLAQLAELLPNRADRVLGTPETETLWDKPFPLFLLILLVTAEWVLRRLVKLA